MGQAVTSNFFDPAEGGDPIHFQHMLWFFGHPEVWGLLAVLLLGGLVLGWITIRSAKQKRWLRLLGIWAGALTGAATLVVWARWMFGRFVEGRPERAAQGPIGDWVMYPPLETQGPPEPSSGLLWSGQPGIYLFVGILVLILGLAVFLWLWNRLRRDIASVLFFATACALIAASMVAGILIYQASIDRVLHDTYYLAAQFHFTACIAAVPVITALFYLAFSKMFGVAYRRGLALAHWVLFSAGLAWVVLPGMFISARAMPRRYIDYSDQFSHVDRMAQLGAVLIGLSFAVFLICIVEAIIRRIRGGVAAPVKPDIRDTQG